MDRQAVEALVAEAPKAPALAEANRLGGQAEVTSGLDAEIYCRRDTVGVGRGDLVVVGPVGATVRSLGGVALDVVVRTLCARIRFCGLGPVPVHGS